MKALFVIALMALCVFNPFTPNESKPAVSESASLPVEADAASKDQPLESTADPAPEQYTGPWIPVNDRTTALRAHNEPEGFVLTLERKPGTLPRLFIKTEDRSVDYALLATASRVHVFQTTVPRNEGPIIGWIQVINPDKSTLYKGKVEVIGLVYTDEPPQTNQQKQKNNSKETVKRGAIK